MTIPAHTWAKLFTSALVAAWIWAIVGGVGGLWLLSVDHDAEEHDIERELLVSRSGQTLFFDTLGKLLIVDKVDVDLYRHGLGYTEATPDTVRRRAAELDKMHAREQQQFYLWAAVVVVGALLPASVLLGVRAWVRWLREPSR